MQAGLHEQPSDNIDLGTHFTTSTFSLPQEQFFQSHQQIRSTEQYSHYKLPSQKQQTEEQTKSYTDQWFYRPHNPNNQTINDFQSEKHKAASSCIVQTPIMRTKRHPSLTIEAFWPIYNSDKHALNFDVFPNNFNGSGYFHQISKYVDLNLITTKTTKTSDSTFRYPLTETTSTFPYQSTS